MIPHVLHTNFTNGIAIPLHDNKGFDDEFWYAIHMRYHNVSFMSQSCLHFLFIQSLYSFSNLLNFLFTSLHFFTVDIIFSFHNHSKEMLHNPITQIT